MADDVLQAIEDTLAPLRKHLETIDAELRRREEEIHDLRAMRATVARVIRAAEPQTKPGPKPGRSRARVSNEKLEALEAWLRERRNGDDIVASEVIADPSFDLMSRATLSYALAALVECGVLRLDRLGGHRGRTHYYRLVG